MSVENFANHLENEKIGLQNAATFDELYELLEVFGKVQGSQKSYTPQELRTKIEQVRHGHRPLESVTRSHGLREAVERLLENDAVYFKYTKGSKAKG